MPLYRHTFPVEASDPPDQFPASEDPRIQPFFSQLIQLGVLDQDAKSILPMRVTLGRVAGTFVIEAIWKTADETTAPQSAAAE